MGRRPCCEKVGLNRGPWTVEEDNKLINFMLNNGIVCWRLVPKLAGLLRCGKSCRLRWVNYLRPDLKRGEFTEAEEDQIIQLHSHFGNKWSRIASHFPGRTDNEIKNHWNTRIRKKLKLLGIDPRTHKPIEQINENDQKNTKEELHPNSSIIKKNSVESEFQEHLDHENNELHEFLGQEDLLYSNNEQEISGDGAKETREEAICSDDFDMLSLEMDPTEMLQCSPGTESNQQNGGTMLDEELQQWLCRIESILLSDKPNGFADIPFQEHEHNIFSENNYQCC